ncbi:hypothetical protein [Corynebacterium tuberculostearicum]|uniref:Uncharacterized protein n=1 Tax=Corynebacterium tuberculostearicum SK141 TaxID=553206 RepID=C6R9M9_9CORY|nr:hypothetical protein [Corynebacterium tuberculostearicum]EET77386.1 hypothetical protein CORTU0001_0596 [Corynebacterium tuberculostearicum SK141]MCG7457935.1 hypothetical protein [Corynebacterium tuberculostearicum]
MILATPFKLIQTALPYVDSTNVVKHNDPTTNASPQSRTGYSLIDLFTYRDSDHGQL